jgi:hypothetical protein
VEPATLDRVQRMIDDETAARFPADAAPRLVLLQHGDEPGIEPGELYLQVVLGQDDAARDAWMEEHADRLDDLRGQRLPEIKGYVVRTAADRPAGFMKLDDLSLLDSEQDELARGLTPVMAHLVPEDLQTLDSLIIAGIAASRSECARWALARVREQPPYPELSEAGQLSGRAGMDRAGQERAGQERLQTELDALVKQRFPDTAVQRVALLSYGDDPWIEPGDLLVRVFIEEAEEEPPLRAWERDHEAVCRQLHRELTEKVPGVRFLEFWFGGDTGHQGQARQRLNCRPENPARPERDLIPVDVRLGPVDRELLDGLITAGIAASRGEAIGWVLARIRERPAYARLSERARELDELKTRF